MRPRGRTVSRLVAIFFAGALAFGYPLLEATNVAATVLGIPLAYAYLFCAWAALIALIAAAVSGEG